MFHGGSSAVTLATALLTTVPAALWLRLGKPHVSPLPGEHKSFAATEEDFALQRMVAGKHITIFLG